MIQKVNSSFSSLPLFSTNRIFVFPLLLHFLVHITMIPSVTTLIPSNVSSSGIWLYLNHTQRPHLSPWSTDLKFVNTLNFLSEQEPEPLINDKVFNLNMNLKELSSW